MTPWLAAIDPEALIWGVLAVVYILAQLAGQIKKYKGGDDGEPERGVPDELRDFLEDIQGRVAREREEDDWPPPPPKRTPPPPIRQAQPAQAPARQVTPPRPVAREPSEAPGKIAAALEHRRHQFQCQLQKQAKHLNERHARKRSGRSMTGGSPETVEQQDGLTYLSVGMKGFKLPSLGLPGASASQQNRTVQHQVSVGDPESLRQALIHSIVLGNPVSAHPPGCQELTKQQQQ